MLAFLLLFFVCLFFNPGSFPHTSRAGFISIWGVFLIHPVLALFLSGEFLLHVPCYLYFSLGRFFCTSHAGYFCSFFFFSFFFSIWGVFHLTHPVLAFLYIFFYYRFLIQGVSPHTSRAGFIYIWGISLTHSVLASFLYGEFLLHIPCWLHFSLGSFSYTSHAGFFLSFFLF